ncbi:MAG: DUF169 domain-containing protein [archaeon]|nr:DUF169 domain-containing protein [archaeon]MCP8313502.1 DUF169 domain-containing protein [archaeon]MCP8320963.1 DUF169 domain-containing protein [archaeon]
MKWEEVSNSIRRHICLSSQPVAIRLFEGRKDILNFSSVKYIGRRTNICQMIPMARYSDSTGSVYTFRENIACVFGAACLGLIKTPERFADGSIFMDFAKDKASALRLQQSVATLGKDGKKYEAIMCAPLKATPIEPQAIVTYVSPAQALRLIIASAYHTGESVEASTVGQASVCSSIAKSTLTKKPNLEIPCMGDRVFGYVQDHEMIFSFPAEFAEPLIEGLNATERLASYPYHPYLERFIVMPKIQWETSQEDLSV